MTAVAKPEPWSTPTRNPLTDPRPGDLLRLPSKVLAKVVKVTSVYVWLRHTDVGLRQYELFRWRGHIAPGSEVVHRAV